MGHRFGMTAFNKPTTVESDIVQHLVVLNAGVADYIFHCTGSTQVMRQALEGCHSGRGVSISNMIGVAERRGDQHPPLPARDGRVWKGSGFGAARGRTDTPMVVDWKMNGKIEIGPMITHVLTLEEINKGFGIIEQVRQCGQHIVMLELTRNRQRQEFPAGLVDNGQDAELAAIMRASFDIVVGPRHVPDVLAEGGFRIRH